MKYLDAKRKRLWIMGAGYVLALVTLVFVVRHLQIARFDFWEAVAQVGMARFLLACLLFLLHFAINALAFVFLSRAMGIQVPGSQLAGAWGGSLLAKYVPGSVWQLVGRGMLLSAHGVTPRQSLVSGLVEQGMSLAICMAIGTCALVWSTEWQWLGLLAILGVGIAPLFVSVWPLRGIRTSFLFISMLAYSVAMIPFALGYGLLLVPNDMLPFLASLFMGVVAGFLAVLVPGGLGVRESVVALMDPSIPASQMLAGLLLARVAILCVECACTIIAHATLKEPRSQA